MAVQECLSALEYSLWLSDTDWQEESASLWGYPDNLAHNGNIGAG